MSVSPDSCDRALVSKAGSSASSDARIDQAVADVRAAGRVSRAATPRPPPAAAGSGRRCGCVESSGGTTVTRPWRHVREHLRQGRQRVRPGGHADALAALGPVGELELVVLRLEAVASVRPARAPEVRPHVPGSVFRKSNADGLLPRSGIGAGWLRGMVPRPSGRALRRPHPRGPRPGGPGGGPRGPSSSWARCRAPSTTAAGARSVNRGSASRAWAASRCRVASASSRSTRARSRSRSPSVAASRASAASVTTAMRVGHLVQHAGLVRDGHPHAGQAGHGLVQRHERVAQRTGRAATTVAASHVPASMPASVRAFRMAGDELQQVRHAARLSRHRRCHPRPGRASEPR